MFDRSIGLEQEFFLVEDSGEISSRADEFLARCNEKTEAEGGGPACMAPEFVKGLVEVNTPPVSTLADLEMEYANNVRLALRAAGALGLRLYPLGTYPLPLDPAVRDEPDYQVQVRTVGPERFVDAGRAGTAATRPRSRTRCRPAPRRTAASPGRRGCGSFCGPATG